MQRLRSRSEFVAVSRGRRIDRAGFAIQAAARRSAAAGAAQAATPRFGFTVTKKVGNAVVRNRIRRRLREVVRIAGEGHAAAGHDYVLVGRRAALTLPFDRLVADLVDGLAQLAAGQGRRRPDRRREQPGQAQAGQADGGQ